MLLVWHAQRPFASGSVTVCQLAQSPGRWYRRTTLTYLAHDHSTLERYINRACRIVEEPLEILLKDCIEVATVNAQNSIQARLHSGRALTCVKQFDVVTADFSDSLTVEVHDGDTVNLCDDLGVVEPPVLAVGDGVIHEAFDFTNGFAPFA